MGANTGYIYYRGEYKYLIDIMDVALAEARDAGLLGKNILGSGFDHGHPHAHRCGCVYLRRRDRSAVSLEGFRGHPRMKPPFPAVEGLYACPTVVNNVETLTSIPQIIEMGGIAWRDLGTEKSGGTKLWSISGHVKKPGVYELPMGYADMEKFIMEDCGGMLRDDNKLKAVIPGGSSVYIMNAGQILGKNVTLDYEGLVEAGSMLGTGGMMVMDETVDVMDIDQEPDRILQTRILRLVYALPRRYRLARQDFQPHHRPAADAPKTLSCCSTSATTSRARSFCPLGDAAAWPIQSAIKQFPEDFKKWLTAKANGNAVEAMCSRFRVQALACL